MFKIIGLCVLALFSLASMADAYRCNEGGKVVITNTPCETSRVSRSDHPPAESVYQAQSDLERQRGYLVQRSSEQREDRRAFQRHADEVDKMYPQVPETVVSSSGITIRGCGNGGSCPTTTTRTR